MVSALGKILRHSTCALKRASRAAWSFSSPLLTRGPEDGALLPGDSVGEARLDLADRPQFHHRVFLVGSHGVARELAVQSLLGEGDGSGHGLTSVLLIGRLAAGDLDVAIEDGFGFRQGLGRCESSRERAQNGEPCKSGHCDSFCFRIQSSAASTTVSCPASSASRVSFTSTSGITPLPSSALPPSEI